MRRIVIFVALLALAVRVGSQEAKVIPLSDGDAEVSKRAWENLQHAQKTWSDVQELLRNKYTVVREGDKDASNTIISSGSLTSSIICADQMFSLTLPASNAMPTMKPEDVAACHTKQEKESKEHPSLTYRRGWESGFNFTSDFKYIVPKVAPVYQQPYPLIVLTPASNQ